MKVLVTGASGFLGTALTCRLALQGHDVIAVCRSAPPANLAGHANVAWVRHDLTLRGLAGIDAGSLAAVFHLAAAKEIGSGQDEGALLEANELITLRLLQSLRGWRGRFMFASSQMVYGDPGSVAVTEDCALLGVESTPYACSKVNAENWLRCVARDSGMICVALRLCGFLEGGGGIDYMIDQALRHAPIELFARGEVRRDYLSLQSGIDAFVAALSAPLAAGFEAINVGSGEAVHTAELARLICEAVGSRSELVLSDRRAPRADFVFDIAKARRLLDFEPAGLRRSVADYARRRAGHAESS